MLSTILSWLWSKLIGRGISALRGVGQVANVADELISAQVWSISRFTKVRAKSADGFGPNLNNGHVAIDVI
ncbi:MAG: hypothetical protein ACI9RO_000237 [Alteromonas macleodii]|jgi:hypothetical protein